MGNWGWGIGNWELGMGNWELGVGSRLYVPNFYSSLTFFSGKNHFLTMKIFYLDLR
ncbi:MAG: hypothetical protein F6K47_22880 [Symploca sp. SIO2E6]|nr:hypothetical protein [Symploca sp. SIO2E6]